LAGSGESEVVSGVVEGKQAGMLEEVVTVNLVLR
jgi:hypothetical protein